MANLSCSRTNRKRSSFATKHFQRKSLKIFDLHPPLRRLVSFVAQIIAWKVRCWVTDTHTHTHTDTQAKYCNPRCACVPRVNHHVYVLDTMNMETQCPEHSNISGCLAKNCLLALKCYLLVIISNSLKNQQTLYIKSRGNLWYIYTISETYTEPQPPWR